MGEGVEKSEKRGQKRVRKRDENYNVVNYLVNFLGA